MLTEGRVRELMRLYEIEGWEIEDLAKRYDVAWVTIWRVVTGRTWIEVTGGVNKSRTNARTEFRAAYIQGRLDQGCRNLSIIAKELGITRQAVGKLIKTRNLGKAA